MPPSLLQRLSTSLSSLRSAFSDDVDMFDGESRGIDVGEDDLPRIEVEGTRALPRAASLEQVWRRALRAMPDTANPWPRANPGFTEILFLELLKLRQLDRAFALLAAPCQQAWGSAAALGTSGYLRGLSAIETTTMTDCIFLEEWTDQSSGRRFTNVAELTMEYGVRHAAGVARVKKTVHLVAAGSAWKCLSFPPK